jgi:hypothetical protein
MNTSTYEDYTEEIVKALGALKSPGLPNVRPLWTSKIKGVVGRIGQEQGFHVCPSTVAGDEQQWLWYSMGVSEIIGSVDQKVYRAGMVVRPVGARKARRNPRSL